MIRSIARLRLNSNSINDHHNIEPAVIKQNNYDSGDNYLFHDHTHHSALGFIDLYNFKGGMTLQSSRAQRSNTTRKLKNKTSNKMFLLL